MTLTVSPPSTGLVGAWGFNEASGTTVADASGTGNTGTISGATRSTAGRYGGALSFDGVNDMVTVADANSLDLTTGMTLEAWVRPATGGDWRTVILKEQPGQLAYALYSSTDNGRPSAHVYSGGDRSVRRPGGAADQRVVAPDDDLGRPHEPALRQRRPGRQRRADRHRRRSRQARCGSAATRSGASGSAA